MADATTAVPVGGGGGGVDWASILPLLASGGVDIYNLFKGTDTKNAATAAGYANPLIPLQPQAQTDLTAFMKDPSSVLSDPGFVGAQRIGAENVARFGGSKGFGNSGNLMAELFSYGQNTGLGYEQQRYNQLMGILQPSPQAGQFFLGGQAGKQNTIGDLVRSLLGSPGSSSLIGPLLNALGIGGGGGDFSGFDPTAFSGVGTGTIGGAGETGGVDPNIDLNSLFNTPTDPFAGFDPGSFFGGDTGGLVGDFLMGP